MIYRKVKNSRGDRYITIDEGKSRFISRSKIPEEVLMRLDETSEVKFSGCIFCGAEGTHKRMVTKLVVALCDEHYFNTTIGQIVAQLREERKSNGIQQVTSS